MARKTITEELERKVVSLYINHTKVADILKETGLGSHASVYKILRLHGIEPQSYNNAHARTIAISIDETTDFIIRTANPPNVSAWVCDIIKARYPDMVSRIEEKKV